MKKEEFSAKNVNDAINDGLAKMGLTKEQAKITVLEQGGFLKKAKVLIEGYDSEGEKALHFIEGLYEKMNVKCSCELTEKDDGVNINVISVDSSAIIGYRGEVLDAVQYLASIVANEGKQDFKRIVVDCEEYRNRRVQTLENLAKKTAEKAVKIGRPMKLEPMNAFERRVIHSTLSTDERVTTASYGEEPSRYLTITPKNLKPRRPYNDKGGYNNDNHGGYNRNNRNSNYNKDNRNGGNRNFNDRPRKPSKADSIANGFSSFGYYGNSGANKTSENTENTENKDN